MTTRSDRRPENLIKLDGGNQRRLTSEDRACGFHQGQSEQSLTNRPVIVTQSDRLTLALQFRGSPYRSPYSCVVPRAMVAADRHARRSWPVGTNTLLAGARTSLLNL
jgi:hypothetical protein